MDLLGFVIELFVGEVAGVDASSSIAADSIVSGIFLSFFGDADLNGDTNPLIFFIGFYFYEEEPFVSFDFLNFIFRDGEDIPASEHVFLGEGLLVRLI